MSAPKAQAQLQKLVEWYGDKETARGGINAAPKAAEVIRAQARRHIAALRRLAAHKGEDPASFAVRQCVGELDYVVRMNSRIADVKPLLLDMAEEWLQAPETIARTGADYGEGTAAFFGAAVLEFYRT